MRRSHDAIVVDTRIDEEFIELHVLLCMCVDQIVIGHAGDREHRLPIQLSVVQTVQQMNAAWT